jgi:hypothetical protein
MESFKTDLAEQKELLQLLDDRRRLGPCWVETEGMEGTWKLGTNYPGYSGRGFRVSARPQAEGTVLRKKTAIDQPGLYSVWARGLLTGNTDRSFAVEVAGKKFPPTHREKGPPKGEFVWRKAGELELKVGPVEIVVHDAGPGYQCPDVIVLAKDPNWKPQ